MNVVEQIQTIRNMNIIEDTLVDYSQTERNNEVVAAVGRVDITDLSAKDALGLGFGIWDEETNLHLIPFYLYDYLEYGQTFESIDGNVRTVAQGYNDSSSGAYLDNDSRFGCLAFGYIPKD